MWNFEKELPSLSAGSHSAGAGSLCAMEMVAYMERLPHSDSPPCTCPVLATYTRSLNDSMPDEFRGLLLPVLPLLVDTVDGDLMQERAEALGRFVLDVVVPATEAGAAEAKLWALGVENLVRAIRLGGTAPAVWSEERVEELVHAF